MLGRVLHTTLEALPKEKALGPNGSYKVFSKLVGCDKKGICEYDGLQNLYKSLANEVTTNLYGGN